MNKLNTFPTGINNARSMNKKKNSMSVNNTLNTLISPNKIYLTSKSLKNKTEEYINNGLRNFCNKKIMPSLIKLTNFIVNYFSKI